MKALGEILTVPYRTTPDQMGFFEHIEANPNIMGGAPVFQGTRIPVTVILNFLIAGDAPDDILREYEGRLTPDNIQVALQFGRFFGLIRPVTGPVSRAATRLPGEWFTSVTSAAAYAVAA